MRILNIITRGNVLSSLALEDGNNTDRQFIISSYQHMVFQMCIINTWCSKGGLSTHGVPRVDYQQMVFQGCIINTWCSKGGLWTHGVPRVYYQHMVFQWCIINTWCSKGVLSTHGIPMVYYQHMVFQGRIISTWCSKGVYEHMVFQGCFINTWCSKAWCIINLEFQGFLARIITYTIVKRSTVAHCNRIDEAK